MPLRSALLVALAGLLALPARGQAALTGVNLAGAEFGEGQLPGTYGIHYTYPTAEEVAHFTALGMNVFRLPFRWERLQRTAFGDFDAAEAARLDGFVAAATGSGAKVILDPHNYARYYGDVVGSAALPDAALADFWGRLAERYGGNPDVIFGLMNEPHSMPTEQWLSAANAAIAAIRAAGAANLVLVPGNAWTGAHSWGQGWYGTPNADVMGGVVDPGGNYAYELHQYLDGDSSGTSPTCVAPSAGAQRLAFVTGWLRARGARGFLGEFGAAANPNCLDGLDALLDYVDANTDVWLGWTYWAAGPWWGDYMFSIEPDAQGNDRPQTAVLVEHLAGTTAAAPAPEGAGLRLTLAPSPARGPATLAFHLAAPSEVEVTLLDAQGRTLRLLARSPRGAGPHALPIDTDGLPAGRYAVRVRAGEAVAAHALTVVR